MKFDYCLRYEAHNHEGDHFSLMCRNDKWAMIKIKDGYGFDQILLKVKNIPDLRPPEYAR